MLVTLWPCPGLVADRRRWLTLTVTAQAWEADFTGHDMMYMRTGGYLQRSDTTWDWGEKTCF